MVQSVYKCFILALGLMFASCSQSKSKEILETNLEVENPDTIKLDTFGCVENGKFIIEHDIDLKGHVCLLSKGISLIKKRGVIKNGILIGNCTRLQAEGALFDKVTIKGTWDVPYITTKLFADLDYENSLYDVVALANSKVQNKVVVEKGIYHVRAQKNADVCVPICNNTDFILNGTIRLKPNGFKNYDILRAKGKNIKISGNGTIIGDKHTHTGTTGEWGMGIRFHHATNATLSGLTIKNCWGDCIYVGGNSRNVLIEKCRLDHGRRQGISVTKASGVTIRKCMITNVSGTNPQYAIDIEPNRPDSVDNILIENVTVRDCEGGFLVVHGAPKEGAVTPWIGNVTIRNCDVKCRKKYPVRVARCEKIEINKCKLYAPDGLSAIAVANSGNAIVQNNNISVHYNLTDKVKNEIRAIVGKGKRYPIDIRLTNRQSVNNNRFLSRR